MYKFTLRYNNYANPYYEVCITLFLYYYRYFFQGALDLYNCDFVQVKNCVFEHNGPTSVIKPEQYRGHSGGLSVGFHLLPTAPIVIVSHCLFRNNTSNPSSHIIQTPTDLVQFSRFTGRGGGCSFPINPLFSLNATIEDCIFEENFAISFAGGLYITFFSSQQHNFTVRRVRFIKNYAPNAGALLCGIITGGFPENENKVLLYNSTFIENEALVGGGITTIFTGKV